MAISPCDRDGLWHKAKTHINRAHANLDADQFEEAGLWAASALELLAKAALARISPLLVADPTDDGKSLLIAAGAIADVSGFKSIPAKGLFSRCARTFASFDKAQAEWIAKMRNEELHSALSPFTAIDQERFWERYWAQAVILIHAQDETLLSFVGARRAAAVEGHLARNTANVTRRVEALIDRAKVRWANAATSQDARDQIIALGARHGIDGEYHSTATCPACGELARIYGDFVATSEVVEDPDGESAPYEELTVESDAFECDQCGLILLGTQFVVAAELPASFETQQDYIPGWDDYGND